jgi:hypothetical protein
MAGWKRLIRQNVAEIEVVNSSKNEATKARLVKALTIKL